MSFVPFFQTAPVIQNQFDNDRVLQQVLATYLSHDLSTEPAYMDLRSLGDRVLSPEMLEAAQDAESHLPFVESYDTFGKRISKLRTSAGWKCMKKIAAEEGIVADAHHRPYGVNSRCVQFAKVYLYHPSSAMFTCPLAMTDGAARLLELLSEHLDIRERLISRDAANMFTSGQWMTERGGGSELSRSETVATRVSGNEYTLHGFKWFSSATDANIALSLGRTNDDRLSLFLVDVREAGPSIQIARLKSKLGTHALPTAELELIHAPAKLLGKPGQGVRIISTILNLTRLWTALTAVSYLRRAYVIAEAYSKVRMIGTTKLIEKPLQARILASVFVRLTGLMHLTFYTISLLGKDECGIASHEEQILLRVLTPLVKAFVSKQSHLAVVECCEMLGGLGYIENADFLFNVARIYRDSLVLCIWEGTATVLALDFARTLKSGEAQNVLVGRFPLVKAVVKDLAKEERSLATLMFDAAQLIGAQLLDEASVKIKDEKLETIASRWKSEAEADHESDLEIIDYVVEKQQPRSML